jgi:Uma2 family endonuclease
MLALPSQLSAALRLTPAQFAELCGANPEAVLELEPDGRLVTMTPTGGTTGVRNGTLVSLLWLAVREARLPVKVFDSSTGFLLPDGSVRSPDAAVVALDRWNALSDVEQRGFPPLCPDLVVELLSESDRLPDLRRKMAAYQANGVTLGWLLIPDSRTVEVWPASGEPRRLVNPTSLSTEPVLAGLAIDLEELWAA